jgi:esterase/lipase superfamily enzyme
MFGLAAALGFGMLIAALAPLSQPVPADQAPPAATAAPVATPLASPAPAPTAAPVVAPTAAPVVPPVAPIAVPVPTPTPARIFYATDRAPGALPFRSDRLPQCDKTPGCMLRFGTVASGRAQPPLADAPFQAALDAALAAGGQELVVYVHGCCTTFETAIDEGVRVATLIAPDHPVMIYTMPTRGDTKVAKFISVPGQAHYFNDENIELWSAPHFEALLERLIGSGQGSPRVHVIAHSLGTRLLLSAAELYQLRHLTDGKRLGEIILAAADLDTATFAEQIPNFATIATRVTVYRSDMDKGMAGSHSIHESSRLGELKNSNFFGAPNVDSVDASQIRCESSGHFYWKRSVSVMKDIAAALHGVAPGEPERARILKPSPPHPNAWVVKASPDCIP